MTDSHLGRREFLDRSAAFGLAANVDEDLFLLGLEEHFAAPELQ